MVDFGGPLSILLLRGWHDPCGIVAVGNKLVSDRRLCL